MVDPAFLAPIRQRLRSVDAEVIELGVVAFMAQLCIGKPIRREFVPAIGHVFAAEDSQFEHLLGGQLRLEFGVKVLPLRFGKIIHIVFLHEVVNDDFASLHRSHLANSYAILVMCAKIVLAKAW